MLLHFFPTITENKVVKAITSFLYSKYHIFAVALMTLLCNIIGFEQVYYYIVIVFACIIPALICDDMLPVLAPLAMTYSSVSLKNNNAAAGTSLFSGSAKINLIIQIALVLVFILTRLVFDLVIKKERRRYFPRLTLGYLALGLGLMLGGLFTSYYVGEKLLYPLVIFLSLSLCYFLLLYLVDWKKVEGSYFFWIMSCYGICLSCEVIYMFISIKAGNTSFVSSFNQMFTGWGMRNNIASQICLCIASPFYLAIKSKKPLVFLWMPVFMLASCALTNSRWGTFVGFLLLVAGAIIYFLRVEKRQRIECAILYAAILVLLLPLAIIKFDFIKEAFAHFFTDTSDSYTFTQGRDVIFKWAIEDYRENRYFGVGFYQCKAYIFENFSGKFVPRRYHNIYLQFLASTGLVGLLMYFVHRYQTLMLTFRKPSLEKTFAYFSIVALVVTSFLDNHFFNIGPGLNYCIALAFIEGMCIKTKSLESK